MEDIYFTLLYFYQVWTLWFSELTHRATNRPTILKKKTYAKQMGIAYARKWNQQSIMINIYTDWWVKILVKDFKLFDRLAFSKMMDIDASVCDRTVSVLKLFFYIKNIYL